MITTPAYVDGGFEALFERRIHTGLYVAVTAAAIAVLVSCFHIYQHLRFFSVPSEQKFVIRLILLVPIYSLQSSLSLALPNLSIFLGAVRDSYEAYVIYTFMALLISVLGGEAALVDILENVRPFKHPWPLTQCMPSLQPGRAFMRSCKMGTLQFVFIKPLTAVLAIVLYHYGLYEEGNFAIDQGYLYLCFINNVSVSVSLYSLVLFYMATAEALAF